MPRVSANADVVKLGVAAFTLLTVAKVIISVCGEARVHGASFSNEYLDIIGSFVAVSTCVLAGLGAAQKTSGSHLRTIAGLATGLVSVHCMLVFMLVLKGINGPKSADEASDKSISPKFYVHLEFDKEDDRDYAATSTLCNVFLYFPSAIVHSLAAQTALSAEKPTELKPVGKEVSEE